jgi:hypothetical protein
MTAHLTRSKSEGLCAVYPKQWTRSVICCGMAGKRIRMLGVSVRKIKALTVKMETVTLIGKGRKNLTCFIY